MKLRSEYRDCTGQSCFGHATTLTLNHGFPNHMLSLLTLPIHTTFTQSPLRFPLQVLTPLPKLPLQHILVVELHGSCQYATLALPCPDLAFTPITQRNNLVKPLRPQTSRHKSALRRPR